MVRLSKERQNRLCTLHPTHNVLRSNTLKAHMELRILRRHRAGGIFAPCLLGHSTSVRLWGKRSRRYNNNSKQQQSQPNMLAVKRRRRSAWPFAVLYLFPSRVLEYVSSASLSY